MDALPDARTLDRLRVGNTATIIGVGVEHRATLAREGVEVGSHLALEASAPFGGPLIVRLGRARLALARSVARTVDVLPSGNEQ